MLYILLLALKKFSNFGHTTVVWNHPLPAMVSSTASAIIFDNKPLATQPFKLFEDQVLKEKKKNFKAMKKTCGLWEFLLVQIFQCATMMPIARRNLMVRALSWSVHVLTTSLQQILDGTWMASSFSPTLSTLSVCLGRWKGEWKYWEPKGALGPFWHFVPAADSWSRLTTLTCVYLNHPESTSTGQVSPFYITYL